MVCKHVKRVKKNGNIRRNKLKMLNSNIWLWEVVVTMHFDGFGECHLIANREL